jgi:hypothetical protein
LLTTLAFHSSDLNCLASSMEMSMSHFLGHRAWSFILEEDRADYYSWWCVFSQWKCQSCSWGKCECSPLISLKAIS